MNINNSHDSPLSDDPEENLRMENELLRLKMQAELAANTCALFNAVPYCPAGGCSDETPVLTSTVQRLLRSSQ